MKIGLYSITYLGLWYRGEALTLPQLISRAKKFGYDGIEIDGKRPHGNPLDWPAAKCRELRSLATAKASKSMPWPRTTTSRTRCPKSVRPRSVTCES